MRKDTERKQKSDRKSARERKKIDQRDYIAMFETTRKRVWGKRSVVLAQLFQRPSNVPSS